MYVCICKKVTDHQIRSAVLHHSVNDVRSLRHHIGACGQCGKCAGEAKNLIKECKRERSILESESLPVGF